MISVIVPVFNIHQYLRRCIDSILAQTYRDLEIILVDDGSTDGCAGICDHYAEKDSRIRVIHKENGGIVSVRKTGLQTATSDIIAYVDGDDWIEPEMLKKMYDVMVREDVDIVLCDRYEDTVGYSREVRQGIPAGRYDVQAMKRDVYPRMITGDVFFEWTVFSNVWDKLFRRKILEPYQMSVPEGVAMGDDALCAYPALLHADSIYVLHEALYHYRQFPASMVKWRPDKDAERQMFRQLYQSGRAAFDEAKEIYDLRPQWMDFMLFLMTARADTLYEGIGDLPYLFPFPGVKKESDIILYGAGTYGQRMYRYLQESGFCTVKALVDRNYTELNKQGIPAIAPDEMDRISCDAIVITVQFYHARHEIFRELSRRFPQEMLHLIDESVIKSEATRKAFRL